MTQCNSLNVKLSNSQLKKLKSAIKNKTEVVLRLSSNVIGNSVDEINFPQSYLSTDVKLSKTQSSKMSQSVGFLGRLSGPLLKTGLPLIKNLTKPLAKSALNPLGLMQQHQQQMREYTKKS